MGSSINELTEGMSFEAFVFTVFGLIFGFVFLLQIIICCLASRAAGGVPRPYREIEPGMVWLLLIPFVSLVWSFFVFPKIANGYARFFQGSSRTRPGDCGAALAFWYCLVACFCAVPLFQYLAFPASYIILAILFFQFSRLKSESIRMADGRIEPETFSKNLDPANPYA